MRVRQHNNFKSIDNVSTKYYVNITLGRTARPTSFQNQYMYYTYMYKVSLGFDLFFFSFRLHINARTQIYSSVFTPGRKEGRHNNGCRPEVKESVNSPKSQNERKIPGWKKNVSAVGLSHLRCNEIPLQWQFV